MEHKDIDRFCHDMEWDMYGRAHKDGLKLMTELRAAREILAKLPKTADGVPITPDAMKVYEIDPTGYIQGVDVKGYRAETDTSAPTPVYYLRGCYSTRAAAEAALAARSADREAK